MDDLDKLISQAKRDLRALERLDEICGKEGADTGQLRKQLAALQKRWEANREQKAA